MGTKYLRYYGYFLDILDIVSPSFVMLFLGIWGGFSGAMEVLIGSCGYSGDLRWFFGSYVSIGIMKGFVGYGHWG